MHGKGTYTWLNGDMYAGDWRNDKRHGKGKSKYTDGEEYDGEWYEDHKHGKGTFKSSSGNILVGEWKNGVKYGEFTSKKANGELFKQVYIQGELVSNKKCVSDVTPIHGLLSSPRSCADDTFDIIILDEHDKECQVCMNKFLTDVDAKKPPLACVITSFVMGVC